MNENLENMKACPFCGDQKLRVDEIGKQTRLWCTTCGGSMIGINETEVKKLWNRRPNVRNKDVYAQRKKHNLCVYCGAEKNDESGVLCTSCRIKSADRSKQYRKKEKIEIIRGKNDQREAD